MLQANNADINVAALNQKVQSISAYRWRTNPLFSSGDLDGGPKSVFTPSLSSEHRLSATSLAAIGLIKKLPFIGTLAVFSYRRVRQLLAPGLNWKQRISLIPVLGMFAKWAYSVVMLSSIRQHIETELIQLRNYERAVKNTLEQIEQRLETFDERLNRLDAFAQVTSTATAGQDNRIASLTRELRALNQAARLPQLQRADTGAILVPPATPLEPLSRTATDSFYIDFEDVFRGTHEDITERLKIYLPYINKFIGDTTAVVVDVGCGRGEWLALLGKQGIKATGIDLNAAMVDNCQAKGLNAKCMDAIQYLSLQPPGSVAVVTGFHIIEHLPFDTLLALFDAALKALRPDGMVIFETPNPENLLVGACNFYYDPTHLNPIVPTVAEFIARQRGFAKAEILRLNPYPDSHRLVEDSEVAKRFNNALYGPQDFALLASKTHET
jgi:O-antigen chain-terminating methyltransferase